MLAALWIMRGEVSASTITNVFPLVAARDSI